MIMNEYYKEWQLQASVCYAKRKSRFITFLFLSPMNDIKWDMYKWVEDYANE